MEPEFWHQRWSENRIGFHQEKFNPQLQGHWSHLGIPPTARVFVPLCGKTLDMLWLANQGHQVLGNEISETACEAFFREQEIPFQVSERPPFRVYSSASITLVAGDFFSLTAADCVGVEGIYDRAALIALPPSMRPSYVNHLTSIIPPGCRGLLISMSYDEQKMQGPPFSVDEDEIRHLYKGLATITLVTEAQGPEIVGNLRNRGLDTLHEKVYQFRCEAV